MGTNFSMGILTKAPSLFTDANCYRKEMEKKRSVHVATRLTIDEDDDDEEEEEIEKRKWR